MIWVSETQKLLITPILPHLPRSLQIRCTSTEAQQDCEVKWELLIEITQVLLDL